MFSSASKRRGNAALLVNLPVYALQVALIGATVLCLFYLLNV
jgi:hypothetical protein